jgi:hypothetical protein
MAPRLFCPTFSSGIGRHHYTAFMSLHLCFIPVPRRSPELDWSGGSNPVFYWFGLKNRIDFEK